MKKFSVHLHIFIKRDLDGDCVSSSNNAPQPCFHKRYFLSLGLLSTQYLHHDFRGGVTLTGQALWNKLWGNRLLLEFWELSLSSKEIALRCLPWYDNSYLTISPWSVISLSINDLSVRETRRWFSITMSMNSCFYLKIYLWTDLLFPSNIITPFPSNGRAESFLSDNVQIRDTRIFSALELF